MAADTLFRRITDYANRADPYPLYAELREHGVARQDDGSYLVGTYHEIAALLHDPRISSDRRKRAVPDEIPIEAPGMPVAFVGLDDPEHERLHNIAMRPFGLTELVRRLEGARLLQDPPPYRRSPTLRGPRHLPLEIGGINT